MQSARRIEEKQIAHLRHAAHVPAQQIGNRVTISRRARDIRIQQRRLPENQVGRLQRPRRLLGERPGDVIVLALGLREGRRPVPQRIEQRREPHRSAHRHHDQHQAHAQRTPAGAVGCGARR